MIWWRRLSRRRRNQEVAEEIQATAELAARREFGNRTVIQEIAREMWGWSFLEHFSQDVRYALRATRRSPGFTTVAILSLALGIGANAAIFSLLNALLLRPLPVRSPRTLVWITPVDREGHDAYLSLAALRQMGRGQQVFSDMFAWSGGGLTNFETRQAYWRASLDLVSGNYFSALGIKPAIGRLIGPNDVRLGSGPPSPVAVLSYGCWQSRFNGDASVIGQKIQVDGVPLTIVGVAEQGFFGLILDWRFDVAVPLGYSGEIAADPKQVWMEKVIGRLRDGVPLDRARAQMDTIWPAVRDATVPDRYTGARRAAYLAERLVVAPASTGISYQRDRFSRALVALMALVGLILLIACVNLATLMLARTAARYRDSGIRVALGASVWRLVRQGVVESALLSLAGSAAGWGLAFWASHFIARMVWRGADVGTNVSPDLTVLVFTTSIATLTALLFGLAPALRSAHTDPLVALQQSSRVIGPGSSRLGRLLMIAEIALSFILVASAGLFVRSLERLRTVDAGFRRDHILTAQLFPKPSATRKIDALPYYRDLFDRIERMPGVRAVSLSHMGPIYTYEYKEPVTPLNLIDTSVLAIRDWIGPGFFDLMGMRLLAGREFAWSDDGTSPSVAVISESLAQRLFPRGDALGQHVRIGTEREDQDREIVGIVNSASLWTIRTHKAMAIYVPLAQSSQLSYLSPRLDIWTAGDPVAAVDPIRRVIESMGQQVTLSSESLTSRIDWLLTNDRLIAWFASFFGVLAILLAAIGLYGLMSYHVTRRTGEIGVRMALGGSSRSILLLVLRDALILVLTGLTAGALAAWAASRLVESILFGLSGVDPMVFATSSAGLLMVALLAAFVPARRAAAIDPMTALRSE
jgi:predicted permease